MMLDDQTLHDLINIKMQPKLHIIVTATYNFYSLLVMDGKIMGLFSQRMSDRAN